MKPELQETEEQQQGALDNLASMAGMQNVITEQMQGQMQAVKGLIPKTWAGWLTLPVRLPTLITYASERSQIARMIFGLPKLVGLPGIDTFASRMIDFMAVKGSENLGNILQIAGDTVYNSTGYEVPLDTLKLDAPLLRKLIEGFGFAGNINELGKGLSRALEQQFDLSTAGLCENKVTAEKVHEIKKVVFQKLNGALSSRWAPAIFMGLSAVNILEKHIRKTSPELGWLLERGRIVLDVVPGGDKYEIERLKKDGISSATETNAIFTNFFANEDGVKSRSEFLRAYKDFSVVEAIKVGMIAKGIEESDNIVSAGDNAVEIPQSHTNMAIVLSEFAERLFQGLDYSKFGKRKEKEIQLFENRYVDGLMGQIAQISRGDRELLNVVAGFVENSRLSTNLKTQILERIENSQKQKTTHHNANTDAVDLAEQALADISAANKKGGEEQTRKQEINSPEHLITALSRLKVPGSSTLKAFISNVTNADAREFGEFLKEIAVSAEVHQGEPKQMATRQLQLLHSYMELIQEKDILSQQKLEAVFMGSFADKWACPELKDAITAAGYMNSGNWKQDVIAVTSDKLVSLGASPVVGGASIFSRGVSIHDPSPSNFRN